MLKRIFILFLLSSCSLSVFAQEQALYSFLNKPLSDKLLAIGVSIMPVEANQQNESLRRVVFNNTEKPRLTLTSAWDLTEKDSISLRIQNAMDWDGYRQFNIKCCYCFTRRASPKLSYSS